MIRNLRLGVRNILVINNNRSLTVFKNIYSSFFVKGLSVLVSMLLIPMTINYINPTQYGIWLTISSVINWMNFFDIGLSNGLRNNLTKAIALNDFDLAKKYVSTTYLLLIIISTAILLITNVIIPYVDWISLLNIKNEENNLVESIIRIVMYSFCSVFILQIINTILISTHRTAKSSVVGLIGQVGVLGVVYLLKSTVPANLNMLVVALTAVPVLTLLIATFYFYKNDLSYIKPSIKSINLKYSKHILNVGGTFFIIQIGTLILFQSNNFIITKVLGPSSVTEFNISYKLFSIIIIIFTTIITPYWPAFADAYTKLDFDWMKKTLLRIRKLWLIVACFFVPLVCLFSNVIYKVWIGSGIVIDDMLSISMGFYVIGYTGLMVNCYFLNGVGKLRIQLILYIIVCFINVPIATYLCRVYGVAGIGISSGILFTVMNIVLFIQSNKIINNKAYGIWNR